MNGIKNQFEISFDTKKFPGKIEAVQVQLQTAIMGPDDVAYLALCEHPLYPQLQRYCLKNPYRAPARSSKSNAPAKKLKDG
ncbi:MAG: hypothetical protein ACLGP3_10410 [Acidobacteriota bacterium]